MDFDHGVNTNEEIKGESRTFVVTIKSCENQTWQGTVNWVEERKRQVFRSALELIKLLDSTFDKE